MMAIVFGCDSGKARELRPVLWRSRRPMDISQGDRDEGCKMRDNGNLVNRRNVRAGNSARGPAVKTVV
jgi:hypothetical protein